MHRKPAPDVVMCEYPEHPWERWKFVGVHSDAWWEELRQKSYAHDPVCETVLREYIFSLVERFGLDSAEELLTRRSHIIIPKSDLIRWNQLGGIDSVLELLNLSTASLDIHSQTQLEKHVSKLLYHSTPSIKINR